MDWRSASLGCVVGVLGLGFAGCDPAEDDASETQASTDDGTAADDAPADDGNDDAPADDGGDDAPADDGNDDAPADDGGDDAPADDGNDDTPADDGNDDTPADDGDDTGGGAGPSFADLYEPIFVKRGCTAGYCHGAGAGGLAMGDAQETYAALVEVAANLPMCDLDTVVVPGDPDTSVLWARVAPAEDNPTEGCFSSMPKDMPALPPEEAELVRAWIAGGAQP